ncbi:hypothetical protein ACEWY4_025356 [Coilia grayii]|uniref:Uncharacterized protein n=1 Tax=Coilia grayii TaxID=363190 RepID=A0ABD1IXB9_9TELE
MAFCPRTFNPNGSWIGTDHQAHSERVLTWLNSAEENNMAPFWKPPSEHPYQYVRATRFSASRVWKEYKRQQAVAQEQYTGVTNLPTSAPQTLRFVGNTSVRISQVAPTRPAVVPVRKEESLTFLGNFTHPPHVTQDQLIAPLNSRKAPVSGSTTMDGVSSTQTRLLNPTLLHGSNCGIMQHAGPSTTVNVQMPAQQQGVLSAPTTHQRQAHALHVGRICSSTVPSSESVETLKNVKNLITTSNNTAALLRELGPLKFVGNLSLPAEVLGQQHNMTLKPAQIPGSMTQEGVISTRVNPTLSTSAAPASFSTRACGGIPTHSQISSFRYTREEYLKMMEHHRYMASYYRELMSKAQSTPEMLMGSVCPEVLHGQQQSMSLKPAQMSGSMMQERIIAPRVNPIPSASVALVNLSTGACGKVPNQVQNSSFCYTLDKYLKMPEHHSCMASYYRELQSKTDNVTKMMMASVCPTELQKMTGGIHDRSWEEEKRSWNDGTGGIVLPDDAVEKLDAIPGVLDLAREMGFLTLTHKNTNLAPPLPVTMPALLERPKLSNAMARALHKHIMRERERKRQEEEEVDKMMEQKMKEEEERKRTKEMEERMSLEETKEQVQKMGEKLQGLQEEKHQLFLQLKKVLHEEEKRRRKEQSDITTLTSASYQQSIPMHSGQHLLNMQGSPVSHSRPGGLLGDRSKQLFQTPVIPGRAFPGQPGFSAGSSEHAQFTAGQAVHEPYTVTSAQHAPSYAPGSSVPISFASSSQIRGASAFQTVQYLPHQPQGFAVHSHFSSQPGFIPSAGIPLQKQLEHANQQSGFTDSASFPAAAQSAPRHTLFSHTQSGQRFYHHSK